jgi:hypothetical protein
VLPSGWSIRHTPAMSLLLETSAPSPRNDYEHTNRLCVFVMPSTHMTVEKLALLAATRDHALNG